MKKTLVHNLIFYVFTCGIHATLIYVGFIQNNLFVIVWCLLFFAYSSFMSYAFYGKVTKDIKNEV